METTNRLKPDNSGKATTASNLVISASFKAGMDGIDRDRIDEIILRESKNSLYMQQQKRRDQKVDEKIRDMKIRLQHEEEREGWRREIERQLDPEIEAILSARRHRSTLCVIDMDMFFMACELLSRPHLKNVPCCVGHNMISTSNYEARKFGVRSAMAGWIADKLVEELSGGKQKLVHVSSNFDIYREKSKIVMEVLKEYDPNCQSMSLDEAKLDLAPYLAMRLSKNLSHQETSQYLANYFCKGKIYDDDTTTNIDFDAMLLTFSIKDCLAIADETLYKLRQQVCEATGGLTCSAGLAPTFALAKIASDANKPDGQKIVGPCLEENVYPFLRPLPTRKINGIGRVTQKILAAFELHTVQDLYDQRALVRFLFQPATAKFLLRASLGGYGIFSGQGSVEGGDSSLKPREESNRLSRKGISRERTFASGQPWHEIHDRLENIAYRLAQDMQEESVWARTISLKCKLHTFDVLQKSRTVHGAALQKGCDLLMHAEEMLREMRKEHTKGKKQFSLRLIGIRCSNLLDATERASLAVNQQIMKKFIESGQKCVSFVKSSKWQDRANENMGVAESNKLGQSVSLSTAAKLASTSSEQNIAKKPSFEGVTQLAEGGNIAAMEKEIVAPSTESVHYFRQEKTIVLGKLTPRSISAERPRTAGLSNHVECNGLELAPAECNDKEKVSREQSSKPLGSSWKDGSVAHVKSEFVTETTNCPICMQRMQAKSIDLLNRALNSHLDTCLNGPVVRQVVKEETQRATNVNTRTSQPNRQRSGSIAMTREAKKQRLTEFFFKTTYNK